ncbi:hypothetical protein HK102_006264 [Quaeritorhiza haematococci]|nr:hypothetical protein HK102_006264 [Quaeritorhiza haematococci]
MTTFGYPAIVETIPNCYPAPVNYSGYISQLVWLVTALVYMAVILIAVDFTIAGLWHARKKNWELSMGISKNFMIRYFLMIAFAGVGSIPMFITLIRIITTLVENRHIFPSTAPEPFTPAHDELLLFTANTFKRIDLITGGVSIINFLLFIFFGTTKIALEAYLGWVKALLKAVGVKDKKVLDKVCVP